MLETLDPVESFAYLNASLDRSQFGFLHQILSFLDQEIRESTDVCRQQLTVRIEQHQVHGRGLELRQDHLQRATLNVLCYLPVRFQDNTRPRLRTGVELLIALLSGGDAILWHQGLVT